MTEISNTRILLPSIRTYWKIVVLTIFFSLAAAVFEGISIGLLIPFLQAFGEAGSSGFQTGVDWIDHHLLGMGRSQLDQIARICGFILFATWCRSMFGYLSSLYATKSRVRIVEDLRVRVIDQLRSVALRFYSTTRNGELLNTITNEIGRSAAAVGALFGTVNQGTLLLIYLVLMIWISWELSLLILFFFGALSMGLTHIVRMVRERSNTVTEASGKLTSAITEFIDGIRTITLYNQQDYEHHRLYDATQELAEATIETNRKSLLVRPLSQGIVSTVLLIVLFLAIWLYVLPGHLDIAFLLTFLFALFRMMPCVDNLNSLRGELARSAAGISNTAAVLRRDNKPYLADGDTAAEPLQDALVFDNVCFEYDRGKRVLHNISTTIEKGKMTAFVGGSGAGKSTLADLLPRLYDPTAGRILYDGQDLRSLKVHSLRDRIAVVSQSTHIFNDSVRNNIAYGSPDATFEEIVEAAKQANALCFIEEMEEGFDTSLGDRGVRLSGGQRQRIAIARAILRDPDILILDEATSALDSVSEQLVQSSLERLMEGRTVIAIAHRLSTIENADWVLVLEEGRVVEQGPYADLLEQRGHLWEYHSLQFQAA